ncbi:hypothetical protein GWK63_13630 [Komagataeibacter rhaeticus]|uniref:Uncharacterized protein n=1 Tax=Komagataeibacter rhaeticus TaxID=215221 RepID=A0A858JK94_9PROT|nr:hypothetical protein [Komagataeibacter rhaeticus]QIP34097.1 hypothetical protein GWK63_13630 [Komagataeibacter rhaeticus]
MTSQSNRTVRENRQCRQHHHATGPPAEWSARMRHIVQACTAYPYAFLRLWDGD